MARRGDKEKSRKHRVQDMTRERMEFRQTELGMLPEDWEVRPVKEVAGVNERTINKDFEFREIDYIDIDSVENGIINNIQHLKLSEAPSRAKRIVKKYDIIISTVRPNLKHFALVKEARPNTIVSTGFAVISSKKIEPKFLYYYLTTNKVTDYLTAIADSHTSTYPSFNPGVIENSLVPYPIEVEQQSIAKALSDLDSKIELNQQMNKKLEEIGRLIFKRWFVDFEFPNEEGKPYKSSGGEMAYNEDLGREIPKGWSVADLSDEFKLVMGQSPPGTSYNESGDGVVFFQGRADFGIRFPATRMYTTEPTRFAKKRDTLVSVRAPVGDINLALQDCCIGRGLAAIRHKSSSMSYTYYSMLTLKPVFDNFEAEGTVFGSISKVNFERIKIVAAPDKIVNFFESVVNPFDRKIEENTLQIQTLSSIRDSLLTKLMSGKIRVPVEAK